MIVKKCIYCKLSNRSNYKVCLKCRKYYSFHAKRRTNSPTHCVICDKPLPKGKHKYCKTCTIWANRVNCTKRILRGYGIEFSFQETVDWLNEFVDCVYCLKDILIQDIGIDHILPKSRGGLDKLSNLQVIHKRCNMLKGSLTHEEFKSFLNSLKTLPKEAQILIERRLLQAGFIFGRRGG